MWHFFQAIKRSWLKHFVTQMSAIFILTVTYTASLFIVLSMLNIKNIFYVWGKVNEVTVYLKEQVSEKHTDQLIRSIEKRSFVESIKLISSEQSAEKFKDRFAKFTPQNIEAGKISSFFPATLKLKLDHPIQTEGDMQSMKLFSVSLRKQFPMVDDVIYGQSWMTKYVKLLSGFEFLSWGLVVIIFMASLFVSMNVLKTVIFSRKEEIEILEFVGATSAWIYAPPIFNGCVLSAIAFAVASLANYGIYTLLCEIFGQMFSSHIIEQMQFFSPLFLIVFSIILIGCVLMTSIAGISNFSSDRAKSL